MAEATMTDEIRPHLFGLAKIQDADTLRQMVKGGWVPGFDLPTEPQPVAGVDAHGRAFCVAPSSADAVIPLLVYPVHVINAVVLPDSMVKPASAAKPYRR